MPDREIAILAKSRKCGSYCIAGKEISHHQDEIIVGNWIRPVSGEVGSRGAVSNKECRYHSSGIAEVLDMARVPLHEKMIITGQPENIQISPHTPWIKTGQLPASMLENFMDSPDGIWLENQMPTDRVSHEFAMEVEASLYLIRPADFYLILSNDWNPYHGCHIPRIRGEFTYKRARYTNLSVTDSDVRDSLESEFPTKGQPHKRMALPNCDDYYLCISLGPQFGTARCHYKFVASILGFGESKQGTY